MNQLLNKVLLKIYLSTIYASLIQIISAHLAESTANIKVGAYFAIYLHIAIAVEISCTISKVAVTYRLATDSACVSILLYRVIDWNFYILLLIKYNLC